MDTEKRRKLLGTIAVVPGIVWAKPSIQSVVLPAHAATTGCTVAATCENVDTDQSYQWTPSGDGVTGTITSYGAQNCQGTQITTFAGVVASSESEAAALLGGCELPNRLDEAIVGEGCSVYICVSPP